MTLNWVKQVIEEDISGDWLTKVNSDGTKFLAARYRGEYVYLSAGNNTWEKANIAEGAALDIKSCTMSGNGQYMLVGEDGGRLYLSANSGTTWSEIRPGGIDGNFDWYGAAINYSGQYMLISAWVQDKLYFSNDYGVTWTLINSGDGYCDAACINDSGSVLVAAGWGGTLISVNYGVTWTANVLECQIEGASCTALGDIIYLNGYKDHSVYIHDGYILRSSDYGVTWTEIATTSLGFDSHNEVTCAGDDSIVLFTSDVALMSSTDRVNWTVELSNAFSASTNASGGAIICGQIDGYVYISTSVNFEFFSNHVVLHLAEPVCLKVLGYPLFDDVRVHSYKNTTQGATVNVISIDDATLVSADIAADVLAKTAEYFNLRYQQDVTLFPDPAIKPCDIRTVSSLYGKCVDGITEKLEGNLTGGYLTATKFVGRERMEN